MQALEAARKAIRPGVTTADLNAVAEEVLMKHGAYSPFKNYPGPYPYPASICTSINEELVHGIPGKRKLEEGDIITMDCGTVFEGFVADSAITVGVGEISVAAQKLIDVTEAALEAASCKNGCRFACRRHIICHTRIMWKAVDTMSPEYIPDMESDGRCMKVPRCPIMVKQARDWN